MEEPTGAELYIVATPLGNLEDLTFRALRVLKSVDLILCEDTRRARKLLSHYNIPVPKLISYYDQVEKKKAAGLIGHIVDEKLKCALISDAGTPLIADPGYRLVEQARRSQQVKVIPVPGPSAAITLCSVAGLSVHRFLFVGFLPVKKSKCEKEIESWEGIKGSVFCYENINRLEKTLGFIFSHYPHAIVVIGRELTKIHEQIIEVRKETQHLLKEKSFTLKGECTLMIEPNPKEKK